MQPDDLDAVFRALAHHERRRILDILKERPGIRVGELAEDFEMSRIGVMKHLAVLEEAGLVVSERAGRERHLHFNAVPIQMIHERWTTEYSAYWAQALTRLKYAVEMKESER
ncbi:MAG: metalloregulator ArsR/SmtB family transcription factor [Planctomycetota bacterium]